MCAAYHSCRDFCLSPLVRLQQPARPSSCFALRSPTAMSEHTSKRARLDIEPEEPRANFPTWMAGVEDVGVPRYNKDEEFWYADGSNTLLAENTGFRVFKGILADHSPFFSDMFSLPQPRPASSPASEDCPVVRLTDSPNEVRYLLRACMPKMVEEYVQPYRSHDVARGVDLSTYSRYVPRDPTYDEIASLIRLGHKYQIQSLVESSLAYLRRYYSDDLDAYDKLGPHKRPSRFRSANAIGVVNLARLTGCMRLLPPALLAVCVLKTELVFNGVPSALPRGQIEMLSMDDIQLCYRARLELASARVALTLRVCCPEVSGACSQPRTCNTVLVGLVSSQHEDSKWLCSVDPFRPYSSFDQSVRGGICRECYAMLEERDNLGRRAMWRSCLSCWVLSWMAGPPTAMLAWPFRKLPMES